jgi:hypothetical protein
MNREIGKRIAALADMTTPELRDEYARVFGEETRSKHKVYLRKRITWGLQARAHGGLSENALRRAEELANESDLTLLAPKGWTEARTFQSKQAGPQLLPGSQLTRRYKDQDIVVTVLPGGFEWKGQTFKSLSAVAKAISGSHCSGNLFFGLKRRAR